jgi:D-inositol-3-phosphate glycosyltransferase
LRILLVSANYRPSVGGIERFVEILAGGLAERGHEVTVATCHHRGGPREERSGGVRVVRIPASDVLRTRLGVPYPVPSPRALRRTLRELIRDAEIVHPQDGLYATTVAALRLARRQGVPTVLTQHVAFVPQANAFLDLAQRTAIRAVGPTVRLADAVASYNPAVAEWARRTWKLDDVRLLPIGVPTVDVPEEERRAARLELGLPEDAFIALFTGRDVPKKRLDVFLGAGDPAYELVAVTDRVRNEDSRAKLVQFMEPERFSRLLATADAFVLPSQAEGFPLALQEALVAGIPCIVTREPGYERFVSDGDVAFVPPEPDAIRAALRRLATDPEQRAMLAAAAQEAGRSRFGVDAFVAAYEGLYAEQRADRSAK